jgi:hypothetical protein
VGCGLSQCAGDVGECGAGLSRRVVSECAPLARLCLIKRPVTKISWTTEATNLRDAYLHSVNGCVKIQAGSKKLP